MRQHFRRPQAMFNKGSLFYSHCEVGHVAKMSTHVVSHGAFYVQIGHQIIVIDRSSARIYSSVSA
jgi:hypothetical protein